MNIRFRKATEKDAGTILAMEKRVSGRTYHAYSNTDAIILNYIIKDNAFLILDTEDQLVGFISYELKESFGAYISDMIILAEFQNKGVGSKALEFVLKRLKNVKRIELVTHPQNSPALKLYLKYGFEIESRKENYYSDGEPRLILAKIRETG